MCVDPFGRGLRRSPFVSFLLKDGIQRRALVVSPLKKERCADCDKEALAAACAKKRRSPGRWRPRRAVDFAVGVRMADGTSCQSFGDCLCSPAAVRFQGVLSVTSCFKTHESSCAESQKSPFCGLSFLLIGNIMDRKDLIPRTFGLSGSPAHHFCEGLSAYALMMRLCRKRNDFSSLENRIFCPSGSCGAFCPSGSCGAGRGEGAAYFSHSCFRALRERSSESSTLRLRREVPSACPPSRLRPCPAPPVFAFSRSARKGVLEARPYGVGLGAPSLPRPRFRRSAPRFPLCRNALGGERARESDSQSIFVIMTGRVHMKGSSDVRIVELERAS